MSKCAYMTVAILAGGLGKRLQPVVSRQPKALVEVNTRPFLQILLDQLNSFGFEDVVICTGFLGKQIQEKFGTKYKSLRLTYSQEKSPLGTGGGLRTALTLLKSETILVMNGDSFCNVNLNEFLAFFSQKKADACLVLSEVEDAKRFGKVKTNSEDLILDFEEKTKTGRGWINAGIYLLKRPLIYEIPEGVNVSLEKETFPKWVGKSFYGYQNKGSFIDIGTPSSYLKAESFFAEENKKVKRFILLDRDGTIIQERNYLSKPEDVELISGTAEALKELKKMGLGLVVITNQSGIGRGYFGIPTLEKIHFKIMELLKKEGIVLDDIYFCPHTPEDNCLCRKPNVGLVEKAMQKHHFDPKQCFVVGDKKADIKLGENIGAKTVLVRTGYGKQTEKELVSDYVVNDLQGVLPIIKNELSL